MTNLVTNKEVKLVAFNIVHLIQLSSGQHKMGNQTISCSHLFWNCIYFHSHIVTCDMGNTMFTIKVCVCVHEPICLKICKGLVKLCRSINMMYGQVIAAESQIIAFVLFDWTFMCL